MSNPTMHGSKVIDGGTYCTDCGARLAVGGYETYKHRNPVTSGRGACPNVGIRSARRGDPARWDDHYAGWVVATDEELDSQTRRADLRSGN